MKPKTNFRKINEFERNLVFKTFENISSNISLFFNNDKSELYVLLNKSDQNDKYPSVYLISTVLSELMSKYNLKDNIMSAGVYFGFIKNNNFFLSLEGAEFLYNLRIVNELNFLYVNDDAEKAILYGNPIKKEMITNVSRLLKKNTFLLIFNHFNELISIGQSIVNYDDYEKKNIKEIIALNLVDKGYYLRKKQ